MAGTCQSELKEQRNKAVVLTVGHSEECLGVASSFVGQVLCDVHVGMHLLPDLLQRCLQVAFPELPVQGVDELG